MRKTKKRFLSALLACAMLISLFPFAAFAGTTTQENAVASATNANGETTYYESFEEAVKAITESQDKKGTVNLLKDSAGNGIVFPSGTDIIIDFGGHTYDFNGTTVGSTGTETQGFQCLKNSDIVLKNGKLTASAASAKMMIQNYCNLTLNNMNLDATVNGAQNKIGYVLSNNFGNINLIGNTSITAKSSGAAFDVYYWPKGGYGDGVSVTVNTTGTITGKIEVTEDGTPDSQKKSALNIKNINHVGTLYVQNGLENNCTITGGTFSSDVKNYVPKDYACTLQNGRYVVQNSSKLEADASASDDTANAVVGGEYSGNETNSDGVSSDNATVSITATTGTDGNQNDTVSTSNVSITNNALTSLSNATGVQNVEIKTDVATVTLDSAALNAMTINANGDGIVLSVKKTAATADNNVPLTYSITAVTSDGKQVYNSDAAAGSVTISVTYTGTKPQVYYVGANGLEKMEAELTGTILSWTTSHFSDYVVLDDSTVATITNGTTVQAFTDLQAAVDAANTGDVVRLEKDVVLDGSGKGNTQGILTITEKNITIDGNGHTISAENVTATKVNENNYSGPSMINIQDNANVTVKNLVIDGGAATNKTTATKHGLNVYQAAVTVENVTIKNGNGYAIVANGSTATVNGLTTENNGWGGINVEGKAGNAALTVDNANIDEDNSIKFEQTAGAAGGPGTVSGTINGGSFQYVTTGDDVTLNMVVNGGTFATGNYAGAVDINDYLAPGMTINPSTGEVYEIPPYTGKYSYAITVADTDNGRISVDQYATEGEDVTITITPDAGYMLDELTVTAGGKDVDVTDNGNGTYTFTMPSSKVQISAAFVEDEDYVEPDTSITISMTIGSNDFVINNNIVTVPDAAPYIANDRTYVPFRALGEALGATVEWSDTARTVTYTLGDTEIVMTIGDTTYTINGVEKTMDVAPEITGDRTYVPVRFVAEGLGFKVTPLYAADGTTASVVFEK